MDLASFYFCTEISGIGFFYTYFKTVPQCDLVQVAYVWAGVQLILSLPETSVLVGMVDLVYLVL